MTNDKKKTVNTEDQDEKAFLKFLAEIIVEIIITETSTSKNKKSRNH